MSEVEKTPRAAGFRMPAEWARHEATWLAWPHNPEDWPGKLQPIPWVYAEIVRLLLETGDAANGVVAEVLGDTLSAGGKYFLFCNNIDLSKKYQVAYNVNGHGAMFYVLPIDDTSVYNELIDFLYLDKMKMKKMDTAEKVDAIADAALKYSQAYEIISFEEGLKRL